MKSRLAEVRTGFEPLLFHIQAELWRQRPFSEGCGGEIPEKRRKIFHKVMGAGLLVFTNQVQRLFCAQKGH